MNRRPARWIGLALALASLAGLIVAGVYFANPSGTASRDLGARLWGSATLSVPTAAMEPTIPAGYELVVDTSVYGKRLPERDELLVYFSDDGPRVGRVVAGPGQSVALRLGDLFVDGELMKGPEGVDIPTGAGPGRDLEETRVPDGHVFVLADNRDLGADSRQHGPVPARRWIGRVVAVRR